MKAFFQIMGKYFAHYKRYIAGTLLMNVLAALFNVFSFTLILPILQILFQINTAHYDYMPWGTGGMGNFIDVAKNNGYYYSQELIAQYGPATTLLLLGIVLSVLTLLKTATYFGGSAMLMPLRTGVVRDIRADIYRKILGLPLSFFSEERKGDILTRVSTDVNEVDASITSSLDMLIKNPIFIVVYVGTMVAISWRLTLFVLLVVPLLAWGIGSVGKKLKAKSLTMQARLSDSMSQIEETLGGLRIIKAFIAERKMLTRFEQVNDDYRRSEEDYQAYVDGFLLQLSESKRARISLTSDIPGAPAIHRFTIPANSSAPAMYMDIASNDGNGIIFETEADTLALALHHGDFSDLLRKAFHGEPISLRRKTNQQQLFVERPYLSICLSGTPEQARTLIKSAENGLFSRFLFYRITAEENYSENDLFEDGRAIQLYFTQLGEKVRDLYLKLQSRSKGVEVIFPREYLEMLKAFTDDFGTEYSNLFAKAYKTEKAVNAARSISRRMGVIVFRIAMIRTMLRYIDQDDIPSTVVCNEDDFYDTLADSSVFMQHAHVAYDEMVNKSTADIAEDSDYEFDPNSADLLTDKQRELLSLLPDSFSTQELLLLNRQLGINPRSLYRIMNALIDLGLIRRISYGHYKKHAS